MAEEPPQLDSTRATDQVSNFVLGHVMEGLTRYGKTGEIVPGVAESWELGETRAIFHLRADARWADGSPVTAHDFVFAWRTAVDPKTASEYAFILYPVKNAEAIGQGKLPTSALGVRARDDRTLEVELERPTGIFLGLTAFSTYLPLKEAFYRARPGRYAADAEDLLSNGPFVLAGGSTARASPSRRTRATGTRRASRSSGSRSRTSRRIRPPGTTSSRTARST